MHGCIWVGRGGQGIEREQGVDVLSAVTEQATDHRKRTGFNDCTFGTKVANPFVVVVAPRRDYPLLGGVVRAEASCAHPTVMAAVEHREFLLVALRAGHMLGSAACGGSSSVRHTRTSGCSQ